MIKLFRSSIFAGVAIGTAGFGFLAAGAQSSYGSLAGAVLFCFGLLTVVGYKLKLYTGTAGFINKSEIGQLFLILFGNIFGCLLVSILARVSPVAVQESAQKILELRLRTGGLECGLLAIGCGFIMTTAVHFARQGQYLPLIFGVPLFIVCGFPHCVADAFYFLSVPFDFLGSNFWLVAELYACIVLGNLVGCNLYRIILQKDQY
jgi:formate/nitrite transporter FocA (FNT family)